LEYLILATDGLWDVVRNEVSPWISDSNNQLCEPAGCVVKKKPSQYHTT
jgi:serine/threonine protein phosphatase PrpC